MAQTNIYDYIIAELIRGLCCSAGNGIPVTTLALSSTINSNNIIAGEVYLNTIFTSDILNLPNTWSVVADTHIISVPGFSDTIGSGDPLFTSGFTITLVSPGNTLVVTSTVDITDGVDTVTLTATLTLLATPKLYYGVKAYSAIPNFTGLDYTFSGNSFTILNGTGVNRLIWAMRVGLPLPISILDQHDNEWVIANDFEVVVNITYTFFTLKWNTQFVGNENRTFTFKYE